VYIFFAINRILSDACVKKGKFLHGESTFNSENFQILGKNLKTDSVLKERTMDSSYSEGTACPDGDEKNECHSAGFVSRREKQEARNYNEDNECLCGKDKEYQS
jgi:hypothetical protein